jgi:hypothetical protein
LRYLSQSDKNETNHFEIFKEEERKLYSKHPVAQTVVVPKLNNPFMTTRSSLDIRTHSAVAHPFRELFGNRDRASDDYEAATPTSLVLGGRAQRQLSCMHAW